MTQTEIGTSAGAAARDYDGILQVPFVWNVALTDAESVALSNGFPPWKMRPQNIVSGVRLDTLYDPYWQQTWTDTGGSTLTGARPMASFGDPVMYAPPAAAAATSPWFFRHAVLNRRAG
jgi:hypothetical protein